MLFHKTRYCPQCDEKLVSKSLRLPFLENLLLGCSFEIIFWIVIGIIASFFTLTNTISALVFIAFLLIVVYFLEKYYLRLYCKSCKQEYELKKKKLVLIKKNE